MYGDKDKCGIIIINGNGFRLYIADIHDNSYTNVKQLENYTIKLQNKHKTGGQSAQRFERLRCEYLLQYVRKAEEHIIATYMRDNHRTCIVKQLIIAGNGDIKHKLTEQHDIATYIMPRVIDIVSINDFTDGTINDVLSRATNNKHQTNDIYNMLHDYVIRNPDIICFGYDETITMVRDHMIETVYICDGNIHMNDIIDSGVKYSIINADQMREYAAIGIIGIKYWINN